MTEWEDSIVCLNSDINERASEMFKAQTLNKVTTKPPAKPCCSINFRSSNTKTLWDINSYIEMKNNICTSLIVT